MKDLTEDEKAEFREYLLKLNDAWEDGLNESYGLEGWKACSLRMKIDDWNILCKSEKFKEGVRIVSFSIGSDSDKVHISLLINPSVGWVF